MHAKDLYMQIALVLIILLSALFYFQFERRIKQWLRKQKRKYVLRREWKGRTL